MRDLRKRIRIGLGFKPLEENLSMLNERYSEQFPFDFSEILCDVEIYGNRFTRQALSDGQGETIYDFGLEGESPAPDVKAAHPKGVPFRNPQKFLGWACADPGGLSPLFNNLREVQVSQLGRIQYMGLTRVPVTWKYALPDTYPEKVDESGGNVVFILAYMRDDIERKHIYKKILKWVSRFGLREMVTRLEEGPSTRVMGVDPILKSEVNMASVGFGVQQVLSIIVQGFLAPPGSTILVEDPEMHLHPEMQLLLMDLFLEISAYGNQVIVTTHSEHGFLRLQRRIAEGKTNPNDVAIHEITKRGGGSTAKRREIKEDGSMPGWIPSFERVTSSEMKAISRLQKRQGR